MKNVILMGGSGYIGTHLMEEWLRIDSKVQIISLSRNGKPDKLLPSLVNHKRVKWMAVDIFNMNSYLSKLPQEAYAIVDLVGTATANSKEEFEKLNVEPVKIMVKLMNQLNIPKGCYISG
ncbi:NAD-dependent epimerase/dehydratase family protein [Paenibacillus sp. FSL F4-0125]|uniref:NAD-dependent epimerase/dehydratase family protein n=1 Tax=Paenibacillus sp. FSL F4-0125 TaxID=2954730 RepID=UPI0030F805EB